MKVVIKMNRAEARVVIMTILYQIFLCQKNNMEYDIDEIINENKESTDEFIDNTVKGVLEHKKEIFDIANKNLKDWKIERLGLPDQAILSIGIYEILYTDTPNVVAINEAIELAKKYSDDKVKNMINKVLDNVHHEK